ncbi:leucine-rich repeat domain-containing protein [Gymnodinialimonas ceratoperidinii]|uniref:Leucine-rich repeat domain-containing protein n=1 Tax=Gymnodinialimonas ceratoperidinii TaxID=2856823 RepID=A0A8F6TY27_9RHOB|nr:hypothetical protein [Gymnodinialimonas ceratoperidinii]QXT40775.1 hypothetical protein KYE46_05950 [Gymnodinialimonas ceratoperidinii]
MFRATTATIHTLCMLALAGCQPSSDGRDHGQMQLDACVAEACTTLNLDGYGMRDYNAVAGLAHVTSLMVSYTDFADLSELAAMSQLRELHMGMTEVTDLDGLAAFPNLEVLHAQYLEPQSFAPVAGLARLRELAVGSAGLDDLSFVAQMPALHRLLVVNSVQGLDLSPLAGHPGLRALDLRASDGMDLRPLLTLPNLQEVALSRIGEDIDPTQAQVVAQLRARGVSVDLDAIVVPVC